MAEISKVLEDDCKLIQKNIFEYKNALFKRFTKDITININPEEYTEKYGELHEIFISCSKSQIVGTRGGNIPVHCYGIDIINTKSILLHNECLYPIHFYHYYTSRRIITFQNDYIYIHSNQINVIIDNCGNFYHFFNKEFKLINTDQISFTPLPNKIIDIIKIIPSETIQEGHVTFNGTTSINIDVGKINYTEVFSKLQVNIIKLYGETFSDLIKFNSTDDNSSILEENHSTLFMKLNSIGIDVEIKTDTLNEVEESILNLIKEESELLNEILQLKEQIETKDDEIMQLITAKYSL